MKTRRTRKNRVNMNENMIYKKNVYKKPIFQDITKYCSQIPESKMTLDPKATGRLMYVIDNHEPILEKIFNHAFINKIRALVGVPNLVPCLEIPVEYRIYKTGSYMDWHRDTKMLPDQLQYECVITLSNTSNSKSSFKKKSRVVNVHSLPNSLIVVRADGISHRVTKTTRGRRTILKLVFKENSM
jgi:hypothetical protein